MPNSHTTPGNARDGQASVVLSLLEVATLIHHYPSDDAEAMRQLAGHALHGRREKDATPPAQDAPRADMWQVEVLVGDAFVLQPTSYPSLKEAAVAADNYGGDTRVVQAAQLTEFEAWVRKQPEWQRAYHASPPGTRTALALAQRAFHEGRAYTESAQHAHNPKEEK